MSSKRNTQSSYRREAARNEHALQGMLFHVGRVPPINEIFGDADLSAFVAIEAEHLVQDYLDNFDDAELLQFEDAVMDEENSGYAKLLGDLLDVQFPDEMTANANRRRMIVSFVRSLVINKARLAR